jgi:hypothetical protein
MSPPSSGSKKRRLKHNGLHGVISQKMILFITTAVKTSNPKQQGVLGKKERGRK